MASISDFQEQLDILSETKSQIKQAIIDKGEEVSVDDSFRSYADKIENIVTLDEGTADANASASDISLNKTAYVNGIKITGTIRDLRTDGSSIPESELYMPYQSGTSEDGVAFDLALHKDLGYGVPPVDTIINEHTRLRYTLQGSTIAHLVGLTGADIRKGTTRFGIAGTYTEDADATADVLLMGKTAYVNGNKITGNVADYSNTVNNLSGSRMDSVNQKITLNSVGSANGMYYAPSAEPQLTMSYSTLANIIFLTPGKLKQGETVLGVSGTVIELNGETASVTPTTSQQVITPTGTGKNALTEVTVGAVTSSIDNNIVAGNIKNGVTILGVTGNYVGSTMKEYSSETDMNNDIANISNNEVVRVIASGTTTYYIKDTNVMVKLIKETETLTPQEFNSADATLDGILGEGE